MVVDIASILSQWEAAGVFDFLLPFILIFAVIFGILTATNILGKNKGVHIIVAFVIALLAIRFNLVPEFFGQAFPRLGVGLAVLLVMMVLLGLFIPENQTKYWMTYGLGTLAIIVGIVVIWNSFDVLGYDFGNGITDNIAWIVGALVVVGIIVAVVASTSSGGDGTAKYKPLRE